MRDQSRRRFCLGCERPRAELAGELFSYRGLCTVCRDERIEEQHAGARTQVADPSWLARWRSGMARAAGFAPHEAAERD